LPTQAPLKKNSLKLLILDTEGKDRYYYRNTEILAQSVGFKTVFKNFYQWLEEPSLANYQTTICFLGGTLLKHKETVLVRKLFSSLKDFNKRPNTNLVLLFPAGNSKPENIAPYLEQLCAELGIIDCSQGTAEALTTKAFIRFCMRPDSKVGFTYNSTLINQTNPAIEPWINPLTSAEPGTNQTQISLTKFELKIPLDANTNRSTSHTPATNPELQSLDLQPLEPQLLELQLLPSAREHFSARAALFLPAGLLIHSQENNKVTLLAKASTFNFADVEENFFRCPINVDDRNELLHIAQHLLWGFYNACSPASDVKNCPTLPAYFSPVRIKANKLRAEQEVNQHAPDYRWIAEGDCSAGWLAPDDYHLSGEKFEGVPEETRIKLKKKALQDGVAFLYDADINLLWFEINTENFLSKLARTPEKEAVLRQQIQPIVDELVEQARTNKKPLPKIFIGTDITSNFRRTLPEQTVVDLFGTTYTKIPSPLERTSYWKQELLDVFDVFCDLFATTLPIDGIFLDFEMYHAQDQAGGYDDYMDFSDTSWHIFCTHMHNKIQTENQPKDRCTDLVSTEERVNYLYENKLFTTYFKCQEHEARAIGTLIKDHLRSRLPNLMIGAYATTLPGSWFYRGMFAGLSDKQHPLILATFNMDAYSHRAWMNKQGIYYLHGVPLLLSKLATPDDVSLVNYFTNYHSFIWFSRPSRIVYDFEKHKDDWWSVEVSKLDRDIQVNMIKKARKTVRNDTTA
jgi:hypothetical protein